MYKKDFILRLIEELAKTVAHILGLKNSGKNTEATEVINETLRSYFKLEEDDLSRLSPEELLKKVDIDTDASWHESLASLLFIKGSILLESGRSEEAGDLLLKSLSILQFLENRHNQTFSFVRKARINEITQLLNTIQGSK